MAGMMPKNATKNTIAEWGVIVRLVALRGCAQSSKTAATSTAQLSATKPATNETAPIGERVSVAVA
jgi:hypothetical protein